MPLISEYILVPRSASVKKKIDNEFYPSTPSATLLLLLHGAFYVRKQSDTKLIKHDHDFASLPINRISSKKLNTHLKQFSWEPASKFFPHYSYYEQLLPEFSACIYSRNTCQWIESFLHTYRALEKMSFALPLIYAKNTKNFIKTYNSFKQIFLSKEIDAELSFFKTALTTILDSVEVSYKFSFTIDHDEYKAISYIFSKKLKITPPTTTYPVVFEFDFFQTISFLIRIRNGLFHSLSGKDNISLVKLKSPPRLLSKLIDNYINCISYLTAKIIDA